MVAIVELVIKVKDTPLAGPADCFGAEAFGLAAEAAATAAALESVDGELILLLLEEEVKTEAE